MNMWRIIPWLLIMATCGACSNNRPAPPQAPTPKDVQLIRFKQPPGFEENTTTGSPDRWVTRAQAFEGAHQPVEALKSYRQALLIAPVDWPEDNKKAVRSRITRLSFMLGVPGEIDQDEISGSRKLQQNRGANDAVRKARAVYARAIEAERASRRGEALALYRDVIKMIGETDDHSLYWLAWQKVEDLSPEGEGPAAIQEKLDQREAETGGGGYLLEGDDGAFLPSARPLDDSYAEGNLGEARTNYLRGMDFVKTNDPERAREAFRMVRELIQESQDPELFRAAAQNLQDLAAGPMGVAGPNSQP